MLTNYMALMLIAHRNESLMFVPRLYWNVYTVHRTFMRLKTFTNTEPVDFPRQGVKRENLKVNSGLPSAKFYVLC